jgi:hypothetical protein
LTSIALGLTCLGCLLLSLSLRRHYRVVFADESGYARRLWPLRLSGYALVVLALWPCVREFGAPQTEGRSHAIVGMTGRPATAAG